MKNTFSIISEDNPGVLMRIANLICRRGYNIDSLSVDRSEVKGLSRFTIIIESSSADERAFEQLRKQLMKLIEVLEARNLTEEGAFVERWFSLVKVSAPQEARAAVLQTAEGFGCRVADIGASAVTLEVTGERGEVRSCIEALRPFGILETAGSGQVALPAADLRVTHEQDLVPANINY